MRMSREIHRYFFVHSLALFLVLQGAAAVRTGVAVQRGRSNGKRPYGDHATLGRAKTSELVLRSESLIDTFARAVVPRLIHEHGSATTRLLSVVPRSSLTELALDYARFGVAVDSTVRANPDCPRPVQRIFRRVIRRRRARPSIHCGQSDRFLGLGVSLQLIELMHACMSSSHRRGGEESIESLRCCLVTGKGTFAAKAEWGMISLCICHWFLVDADIDIHIHLFERQSFFVLIHSLE